MNNLQNKITALQSITLSSKDDVEKFITSLFTELNIDFNPDTYFDEYVAKNGEQIFTEEQCVKFDTLVDEAIKVCDAGLIDIYELTLNCKRKLGLV